MFRANPLRSLLLALVFLAAGAGSAVAASAPAPPQTPQQITWQSLSAPNDWAAGVIRELFPINLASSPNPLAGAGAAAPAAGTALANEHSVFGTVMGAFNAIIMLIAISWFAYASASRP